MPDCLSRVITTVACVMRRAATFSRSSATRVRVRVEPAVCTASSSLGLDDYWIVHLPAGISLGHYTPYAIIGWIDCELRARAQAVICTNRAIAETQHSNEDYWGSVPRGAPKWIQRKMLRLPHSSKLVDAISKICTHLRFFGLRRGT